MIATSYLALPGPAGGDPAAAMLEVARNRRFGEAVHWIETAATGSKAAPSHACDRRK